MNETVKALLQRQAERRRQRRIRTIKGIASVAIVIFCIASLIQMEIEDHAEAKDGTSVPVVTVQAAFEAEPEPVALADEEPAEEKPGYTEAELEALALVIYQEAGGDDCSDETRLMVGTVVMNRVADSRYPDSIEEVLTQRLQYGRFYWTGLVWPDRASNPDEAEAVERAYVCAERVLNGERALPADVIFQAEFEQGTEIIAQQDGFYFCK